LEDAALYHSWAEAYLDDWRRFGMEEIAPFPEDLLRQAQQLHGAQRLLGLNAIRSNPRICGYNLTGTVDQGMTAEGLWSTWREFKPGVLDAVAEGLAPLRWCLFVEPLHAYRGQGFKLDVVLADEDVLAPGEYPVTVRVFGPAGCVQETTLHVWERALTLTVPVERPLAVPLLSEEIRLDGPAGAYVLAANMERGGAPAGGRTTFYLDDPACQPKIAGQVTVWEDDDRLGDWLASRGATVRAFTAAPAPGRETILVGDVSRSGADAAAWQDLARRATRGAFAIFLSPAAFRRGDEPLGWLPLAAKGRCDIFYNSIYHREDVAKRHPIFNGLPAGGIMDWTYYRDVIGDRIFQGQEMPAEVVVASFALGYTCPTGYTSGIVVGIYPFAAGRFLVNTLRLVENLGVHPVADRIVLNMLACASGLTLEPLALLPADFDTRLATIEYQ
jgi:hypothetical protein